MTILDSSKLNELADDNFKFDENTVGKSKIAHYGHFLLFPQCFQKTSTAGTQKPRVCLAKSSVRVENIAGLEENAYQQHFPLSTQCFQKHFF